MRTYFELLIRQSTQSDIFASSSLTIFLLHLLRVNQYWTRFQAVPRASGINMSMSKLQNVLLAPDHTTPPTHVREIICLSIKNEYISSIQLRRLDTSKNGRLRPAPKSHSHLHAPQRMRVTHTNNSTSDPPSTFLLMRAC